MLISVDIVTRLQAGIQKTWRLVPGRVTVLFLLHSVQIDSGATQPSILGALELFLRDKEDEA
jgi:hypothetical protein